MAGEEWGLLTAAQKWQNKRKVNTLLSVPSRITNDLVHMCEEKIMTTCLSLTVSFTRSLFGFSLDCDWYRFFWRTCFAKNGKIVCVANVSASYSSSQRRRAIRYVDGRQAFASNWRLFLISSTYFIDLRNRVTEVFIKKRFAPSLLNEISSLDYFINVWQEHTEQVETLLLVYICCALGTAVEKWLFQTPEDNDLACMYCIYSWSQCTFFVHVFQLI